MNASPEFLTVPELADLLRIKERKVYDLAASGTVPCTRATGKLLFPEQEVRAWIANSQSGQQAVRPPVFLGSNDPLLEWALRQSQCGLATFFDGSSDGLNRFAKGEGIATGLHIQNIDNEGWNTDWVTSHHAQANTVLLSWAKRHRGLVFKTEAEPKAMTLADMAGLRVATRQPQSGTAKLFDRLVDQSEVGCFERIGPFFSEQDAVLAVQDGATDVAFGLQGIAHHFGLSFSPIIVESFDLLVDRAAYFEPAFQTFVRFCGSSVFLNYARSLPGYEVENVLSPRWNA